MALGVVDRRKGDGCSAEAALFAPSRHESNGCVQQVGPIVCGTCTTFKVGEVLFCAHCLLVVYKPVCGVAHNVAWSRGQRP